MSYFKLFFYLLFVAAIFVQINAGVLKVATEQDLMNIDSSKPQLVAFTAEWVGSNKKLEACFAKWASKYGALDFVILDIDKFTELMDRWNISTIPTIMLVDGVNLKKGSIGKEKRFVGFVQKKIEAELKSLMRDIKKSKK
jgi:thioredoxin-like negative regulator of GroEL